MKHKCLSRQFFSSFSFFLSFFFFLLSFLFTFFFLLEKVAKSTHSFTIYETNLFSFFLSFSEYIHTYHHHHHHHIALVARISLTLSRHSSLSFIALGRSSGQHPVSSHSCWMYVRAGRPAFARPCVGIHKSTSLMSSSLLLQQCPACLVRLTWIVFVNFQYLGRVEGKIV